MCLFSSNMDAESADPFVATATTILTTHRRGRRGRWAHLSASAPTAGVSAAAATAILLHLRRKPVLALRFFEWALRPLKHCSSPPVHSPDAAFFAAAAHVAASARRRADAIGVLRVAVRRDGALRRIREVDLDGEEALDGVAGAADVGRSSFSSRSVDEMDVIKESSSLLLLNALARSYRTFNSAPLVFDALVVAYIDANRTHDALCVARRLQRHGIPMSSKTANSLLRAVSRAHGADAVLALFHEFFNAKASPNVHTFNVMLLSLYQENRQKEIDDLLTVMERAGCKRNAFTYCVLIAGWCDRREMEMAEVLWKEMTSEGITADAVVYNTMIGGYCGAGNVLMGEKLFKEMERNRIEHSEATFEHLIKGHCKVGDVDAALLVCNAMKRRGFGMTGQVVEDVVVVLCENGRIHEAVELLQEEAKREVFSPTKRSYEVLILRLCDEGDMEAAMNLQAGMAGKGIETGKEVYSSFIRAYTNAGEKNMAIKIEEEMLRIGFDV